MTEKYFIVLFNFFFFWIRRKSLFLASVSRYINGFKRIENKLLLNLPSYTVCHVIVGHHLGGGGNQGFKTVVFWWGMERENRVNYVFKFRYRCIRSSVQTCWNSIISLAWEGEFQPKFDSVFVTCLLTKNTATYCITPRSAEFILLINFSWFMVNCSLLRSRYLNFGNL